MTARTTGRTVVTAILVAAVLPGALGAQVLTAPDDWIWRLDAPQREATEQDVAPGEWRYARMPPGWHITTTEQGVTLFPKGRSVAGRWAVEAEVFLFPDPSDAPLGIVLEASDAPEGQAQLRFLIRRDGQAAVVALHGGADTLLMPWRADTAVRGHPGTGVIKYVLRVTHEAGTVAFAVNGKEMIVVPTNGSDRRSIPGLRIGPGLNVHVSRFDLVTPLAPPRPR